MAPTLEIVVLITEEGELPSGSSRRQLTPPSDPANL